jgi:hypothetical protein
MDVDFVGVEREVESAQERRRYVLSWVTLEFVSDMLL